MKFSCDSFYPVKDLYEPSGTAALEINLKKPVLNNRVENQIEEAVLAFAIEQPAYGQLRVSNDLKNKGILISPGCVRSIWLRHDLETFQKCLKPCRPN